jgi:hypothetical protein
MAKIGGSGSNVRGINPRIRINTKMSWISNTGFLQSLVLTLARELELAYKGGEKCVQHLGGALDDKAVGELVQEGRPGLGSQEGLILVQGQAFTHRQGRLSP